MPLLRAIDKGLVKSRAGIVLVPPALLIHLVSEGIDKELSELLARDSSSQFCTKQRTRLFGRSAPYSARESA